MHLYFAADNVVMGFLVVGLLSLVCCVKLVELYIGTRMFFEFCKASVYVEFELGGFAFTVKLCS